MTIMQYEKEKSLKEEKLVFALLTVRTGKLNYFLAFGNELDTLYRYLLQYVE